MGKTWVYRTHYDGHGLENLFIHCSLDTHSRVGRRWASPVVTLEDHCMHTFEFSRGTLVPFPSRQPICDLCSLDKSGWMDLFWSSLSLHVESGIREGVALGFHRMCL
jgi:hypothetical protein